MLYSIWRSRLFGTALLLATLLLARASAGAQDVVPRSPGPQSNQPAGKNADTPAGGEAQASGGPPVTILPGSVDPPQSSPANALGQLDPLLFLPAKPVCPPNACTFSGSKMCCQPAPDLFSEFLKQSGPPPLTPRDKLILAGKHVIDPFNILTIVGSSAIAIASNSDSVYGPGMPGFAREMGVSFAEDFTSEFFGTFLIPSLVGQDPHYHRMPNASMRRRVAHAIYQVVWTQGDTGRPMFNYANTFGTVADDLISDLYVPGRRHSAGATAARVGTSLATDPIDNFISEFLPDLASHVNVRIVFVQRIINRVALDEGQTHF